MVYILLTIAVLTGLFGLYRFFLNADIHQIKSFFLVLFSCVIAISLFYMAITGRLAAAIGLIAAALPIGLGYLRQIKQGRERSAHRKKSAGPNNADDTPMTRKKALEILGLTEGATPKDIESSYKKLMKKIHPDQEGSAWLATQINQARDFLIHKNER